MRCSDCGDGRRMRRLVCACFVCKPRRQVFSRRGPYNIRYLAIYIGSLKVCNVHYILSYKHHKIELYTRNAVKNSFLLSWIDIMLNYGLKSQQMVLHANWHSEMVLTIFTILFGVIIFNSL